MSNSDNNYYSQILEHFKQLNYPDKLGFFHSQFGIIPFLFPDFTTEISWYNNESQLALLIENFYIEKPKKFVCEKIFIENTGVVKFSVQPVSPVQRIQYNRFIISAFLQLFESFKKDFDVDLQTASDPIEFLTSHMKRLTTVQQWIQCLIDKLQVKASLRLQFLQIVFNGFNFYSTGKQATIQKRRKFVELYLFSQGLFFADHLSTLQRLLTTQGTYHTFASSKPTSLIRLPDQCDTLTAKRS